jgi:hypothetical protein
VSSSPVPLDELVAELTRLARTPGWTQLFCGPDVTAALDEALPLPSAAPPLWGDFHDATMIARMLAVDIILAADSPPGAFRLVHHHAEGTGVTCEVDGTAVSHRRCLVVLEGTLTPG